MSKMRLGRYARYMIAHFLADLDLIYESKKTNLARYKKMEVFEVVFVVFTVRVSEGELNSTCVLVCIHTHMLHFIFCVQARAQLWSLPFHSLQCFCNKYWMHRALVISVLSLWI